jgi:hypothetical protein
VCILSSSAPAAADALRDFTDVQLIGFFQEFGILCSDDELFSREQLLRLVRAAYWQGVTDHAGDLDGRLESAARAHFDVATSARREI